MRANPLATKLRKDRPVLGLNVCSHTSIIECIGQGWDFIWIDAQHGHYDLASTLRAIQTADLMGLSTMVRAPSHENGFLGPIADLAPAAVMVPMINDAHDAQDIVQSLRFPPLGQRSYGGCRVINLYGRHYYQQDDLLIVAQMETPEAVDNAAAIIETEGIDALFFGPDDMKIRLGIDINTPVIQHPRLREALEKIATAAAAAKKICGTVAPVSGLEFCFELGYRMLVGGGDIALLRAGSAARLKELTDALGIGAPATQHRPPHITPVITTLSTPPKTLAASTE